MTEVSDFSSRGLWALALTGIACRWRFSEIWPFSSR